MVHSGMTDLVSVLIPCHNAAPWIAETLASVRAQTWPRCEIIVVDDGSTDGSPAILEAHAGPDLKVIRQENRGAAAARQRALAAARGAYLQYLDADDLLHPEKIARQVARLRADGDRHVASARWVRFSGARDEAAAFRAAPEPNWGDFAPADYLVATFAAGGMMHPAAWLLPRAIAERAGPWLETLSLDDDGEYFARVVAASAGVRFCPGALAWYRSNLGGSLSGRRSAAAWQSAAEVCRRSTGTLLALEASPRARRACALYWQRLAFAAYPDACDVTELALGHARELDPGVRRPPSGPGFERLARLTGWKFARRLQRALRR